MYLFGNFNCTKAFLPKIKEQGWGRVITMASMEEIAAMEVYLASEDAKGVIGQAINICGGAVFH